jgi:hypothetical protein
MEHPAKGDVYQHTGHKRLIRVLKAPDEHGQVKVERIVGPAANPHKASKLLPMSTSHIDRMYQRIVDGDA